MPIGPYTSIETLAAGPRADILRGSQAGFRRSVILKRFRERPVRLFDPGPPAATGHPAVVDVTEILEDEQGREVHVRELLNARSLSELLARGDRLPVPALAGQLVAALAALHAAGRVHGNLKPTNVLVGLGCQAYLVEAGVLPDPADPRASWRAPTTPGDPGPPGPAADVRALGLILAELAAARLLFDGPGAGAAAELPEVTGEVAGALMALAREMTDPDPVRRLTDLGVVASRVPTAVGRGQGQGRGRGRGQVRTVHDSRLELSQLYAPGQGPQVRAPRPARTTGLLAILAGTVLTPLLILGLSPSAGPGTIEAMPLVVGHVWLETHPASPPPPDLRLVMWQEGRVPMRFDPFREGGRTLIRAEPLHPGTTYAYRFESARARSEVATVRTLETRLLSVDLELWTTPASVGFVLTTPQAVTFRYRGEDGATRSRSAPASATHRFPVEGSRPHRIHDLDLWFEENRLKVGLEPDAWIQDRIDRALDSAGDGAGGPVPGEPGAGDLTSWLRWTRDNADRHPLRAKALETRLLHAGPRPAPSSRE